MSAEPVAKLPGVWYKIEMVFGGMVLPVLEKIHLEMRVELRRERRSKPSARPMSVRRKQYNMRTMFEERAKKMEAKNLTVHPPARLMPTEIGAGVLCGNNIINS
jgi:hypothetical protein